MSAERQGKLRAAEEGLALTPPMGWYPWNAFGQEPQNEQLIREIAGALITSGMKDAGYVYVGPDEGICFSRGGDGRLTTNLARYPSGLRGLGDHLHRKGLKYALYTDAGTLTCSKAMPGTKDHEVDVRLDNTEPVSGKPMSAACFDVDLEVPADVAAAD